MFSARPWFRVLGPIALIFICAVLSSAQTGIASPRTSQVAGGFGGKAILTLTSQDCVYRSGDDPAWSSPYLDDSTWEKYGLWHADLSHPRLWIRCRANLSALSSLSQPALQLRFYGPNEIYLNGKRIGGSGNLATGNFSLDAIRSYPLGAAPADSSPPVIAVRVFDRSKIYAASPISSSLPFRLRFGDASLLEALRASEILSRAQGHAVTIICYSILGILSITLFALFVFDPSRKAVLLLAIYVVLLAVLRWNEFAAATFSNYPFSVGIWISLAGAQAAVFVAYPFYFVLAGRRIPRFIRILMLLTTVNCIGLVVDGFALSGLAPWVGRLFSSVFDPLLFSALLVLTLSPYIAFWPMTSISPRMRPIATLCMLWTTADFFWFLLEITALPVPGIPNLYARWGLTLLNTRGIITCCVVVAIFGLLFREQRQISLDRATLAGELRAAGEIQRLLAPAEIDTAPGMQIEVAFRPMREVGGDFYLCRVLPNGHQRILLGDVSGKGAAAAMSATLLLGAAEERLSDSPCELLSHMNRVMCRARLGGFATCLCVDLAPNGVLALANAGHLSPYFDGNEIQTAGALPLGLAAETIYAEAVFQLAPQQQLTLITDGVVEAREKDGALFGFERTAAISRESAERVAQTAQEFGQDDDITVLTAMLRCPSA